MKLSNSALTIGIAGVVLGAMILMGTLLFFLAMRFMTQMFSYTDPSILRMMPPTGAMDQMTPFIVVSAALSILCILCAVAFLNNRNWGRKGFMMVLAGLIACGLAQHLTYCTALSGSGNNMLFYTQIIYGSMGMLFWCAILGMLIWFLRRPALRKQFEVR